MGVVTFALFLFSGTFVPADAYPPALRWVIEVTPLYQAVELLRDLTTGRVSWPPSRTWATWRPSPRSAWPSPPAGWPGSSRPDASETT